MISAIKNFCKNTSIYKIETSHVNIVYKYLNELKNFHLWSDDTEAKVFDVYSKTQDMGINSLIQACNGRLYAT